MSETSMAGCKSRDPLDAQDYQHTTQFPPVLVSLQSTNPPRFPYQLTDNNGHVRPVNLQLRRVTTSTVNPKIPIPRTANFEPRNKVRARHACSQCRERKAKCTGHQPCQRCAEKGVDCFYELQKRNVLDRQIAELSAENQVYQDLLRDLYPRLDIVSAQKVEEILDGSSTEAGRSMSSSTRCITPVDSSSVIADCSKTPEHDAKDEEDNNLCGTKDFTDEDFNSSHHMQATGIVGAHSATAWLLELKRNLAREASPGTRDKTRLPSISAVNYFQGEARVEMNGDTDLWARPPREAADQLVDYYFSTIHPEFPVIGKITFCWQYRSYFSNSNARPGRRWTALLNLIFAIAAKRLPSASGQDERSTEPHTTYFARAWQLSIDHVALADHPDIQQVQVEGLTAFYLVCVGEINRAWRMLGTAIQSALAMGLNLRNAADEVHFSTKEIRYRVWWALFVLDSSLQVITGRPSHINTKFCTTPLPIPYREEDLLNSAIRHLLTEVRVRDQLLVPLLLFAGMSDRMTSGRPLSHTQLAVSELDEAISNIQATQVINRHVASSPPKVSLFFVYTVDLAHLTHKVIENLYSPQRPQRFASDFEILISVFNKTMDQWLWQLPEEFDFTTSHEMRPPSRQSVSLGLRFYAARIIINRPCLHHLAYTSSRPHPSRFFYQDTADLCIRAACEMLNLLPSKVDLPWLYGTTPWWQVLHYIMLSVAVLLTQLFMRSEASSIEEGHVIEQIQKGLCWLKYMSNNDPSAAKAWLICNKIFSQHGSRSSSTITRKDL